jgi:hypothetical protein
LKQAATTRLSALQGGFTESSPSRDAASKRRRTAAYWKLMFLPYYFDSNRDPSLRSDKEKKLNPFRHILHQFQQHASGRGGMNEDIKMSAGAYLDFL